MKKVLLVLTIFIAMIGAANAQYCTPTGALTCTSGDLATNVTFAGINNNSGCTGGYSDYSATVPPANVLPGATVPMSVTVGNGGTENVAVWIDYNHNNTFDPAEYTFLGSGNNSTVNGSIAIPASALTGVTRMRVRVRFSTVPTPTQACDLPGSFGEVEDYSVNIQALTPCTGTPNPGNTVTTANSVCPGSPFTLSPQNNTPGSGVTYVWQSSSTGAAGSFTPIGGATSPTYTVTNLPVPTYYQVVVTCGGNSGTSTPVLVSVTPPSGCYCASSATNVADEDIFNVTIGTLNNSSNCASVGPGPGSVKNLYSNYTTGTGAPAAPSLVVGTPYTLSVSVGTCGTGNFTNSVAAWIDFNQNGAFDATERVMTSASGVGPHTETVTVTIPTNAVLGTTRMRVITSETGTSTTIPVCGNYTYGETEDYNVTIAPCVPATVTTAPAAQTATCGGNATFTAALAGSPSIYQWQVQTTPGGIWTNLSNTAPYSGVTTNTLTVTGVTPTMNGYNYRLVYSNGCTGTSFTAPVALTVNPITATFTQSPTALCEGGTTAQAITVTGGGTGVFTPNGPGSGLYTDAAHNTVYTGTPVTTVYAFPTATSTYSYVRTNGACVSAPVNVTVTVNTPLTGPAVIPATTAICANGTGTISATGIVGTGLIYQWQVNSTAAPATFTNVPNAAPYSGATTATLTISNPSLALSGLKYQLVVTSASCGTSITSNPTTLTVNTVPVVTISASGNTVTPTTPVVLTATTTSATAPLTYQWYLNNVLIPGATGQSYSVNANQPGDYSVTVTDANGCATATSSPLTITVGAGGSPVLFISPSPNNGVFNVRYFNSKATPTMTEGAVLNVFDDKGSRVFTQRYILTGPYTQMRVNLGTHGGGIYRVELADAQGNRLQTGSVLVF